MTALAVIRDLAKLAVFAFLAFAATTLVLQFVQDNDSGNEPAPEYVYASAETFSA